MVISFPYIESEDDRYAYAVATIRSLETRLLTSQKISRLMAMSGEELLKSLGDTDYAQLLPNLPREYEDIISRGREVLFLLMEKLILDLPIIQFLKSQYDSYNIKMCLKAKITETEPKSLSPYGNISLSEITDIFRNELYFRLPSIYEEGIEKAVESYYIDKDPGMLDIILDKSFFEYRSDRVLESGNLFISALHKIEIDLVNIKTLIRTKWAKVDKRRFSFGLIDGGFIPSKELLAIYDETGESVWEYFKYTPYSHLLSEGAPPVFEKGSFLKLEKFCDDVFIDFSRHSKYLAFGVEPVVTYFYAKENEFKILRMLFTASIYGIEEEFLKERLPETFI